MRSSRKGVRMQKLRYGLRLWSHPMVLDYGLRVVTNSNGSDSDGYRFKLRQHVFVARRSATLDKVTAAAAVCGPTVLLHRLPFEFAANVFVEINQHLCDGLGTGMNRTEGEKWRKIIDSITAVLKVLPWVFSFRFYICNQKKKDSS